MRAFTTSRARESPLRLDDLIRSKEIAGRPKDRVALLELRELLARQQQREIRRESELGELGFEP